jgi:pimeloyl-ACP methyl ester carboxylesterase
MSPQPKSHFITVADGLKIHAREYAGTASHGHPIVCMPGLARTAMDFDKLATALAEGSAGKNRRVIAIDYRGRGLSDRDSDWQHYDMRTENSDILQVLAALEASEAIFIGTSRGGLHILMMGATRPAAIRAAVMNDIGPIIEAKGLARIKGYVGKLPQPRSWDDAVELAKRIMGVQFVGLSEDEWLTYAQLTFEETDKGFVPRYDTALMKSLDSFNLEQPLPVLWPQFAGLAHAPLLAIRGENSDLLAQETLEEMTKRHPDCEAHVVPGQGHAPLLMDETSIQRVSRFIARVDP